jgi:hypothetical protein
MRQTTASLRILTPLLTSFRRHEYLFLLLWTCALASLSPFIYFLVRCFFRLDSTFSHCHFSLQFGEWILVTGLLPLAGPQERSRLLARVVKVRIMSFTRLPVLSLFQTYQLLKTLSALNSSADNVFALTGDILQLDAASSGEASQLRHVCRGILTPQRSSISFLCACLSLSASPFSAYVILSPLCPLSPLSLDRNSRLCVRQLYALCSSMQLVRELRQTCRLLEGDAEAKAIMAQWSNIML